MRYLPASEYLLCAEYSSDPVCDLEERVLALVDLKNLAEVVKHCI